MRVCACLVIFFASHCPADCLLLFFHLPFSYLECLIQSLELLWLLTWVQRMLKQTMENEAGIYTTDMHAKSNTSHQKKGK